MNSLPIAADRRRPHDCFLVSSTGAYAESGLGTGGFTCVHRGVPTIVDKVDSTGLFIEDGVIYRFARGLQSLAGYDGGGFRYLLRLPEWKDIHDVYSRNGEFICVSTGTNEVVWLDRLGRLIRRKKFDGEGDAWHVNCLYEANDMLYLSAFGRFSEHRGWKGKIKTGFLIELESGREVLSGLTCPHNPRFVDGRWVICDSFANSLVVFDSSGPRTVQLNGFTRGLAIDENHYYVGESANRKLDTAADASHIVAIDRQTLEIVQRWKTPFPEIYELLAISPDLSETISQSPAKFQMQDADARSLALENQVAAGLKEIAQLKEKVEKWRRRKGLGQWLADLRKRVLGSTAADA